MATKQNEECLVKEYCKNISKKICQNTCSKTAIKANFHFSHYKSMETLSCHNDQSTLATAIKTLVFRGSCCVYFWKFFSFISHIAFEELLFDYFSVI